MISWAYKNGLRGIATLMLSLLVALPKASAMDDGALYVANELGQQLSLELKDKIFQGEVFSHSLTAWQIKSDVGFATLLQALSKQHILQQYHSIGNLMMLSGEYGQYTILLQIERLGIEAYHGILSVIPAQTPRFSGVKSEQLYWHLLQEIKSFRDQTMSWLPESAIPLMNIKTSVNRSQHIYLDPMEIDALNDVVKSNLLSAGWIKSVTPDFGLSLWSKQSQQLRLYFSPQAEGTALYVLSYDLSKDTYENTD